MKSIFSSTDDANLLFGAFIRYPRPFEFCFNKVICIVGGFGHGSYNENLKSMCPKDDVFGNVNSMMCSSHVVLKIIENLL